jgi:hypothetical protein
MQIKPLLEINLLQYNSNYKSFLETCEGVIDGITIINKTPFDQPIPVIQELIDDFPTIRIIPHLSLKQNYQKSSAATLELLQYKIQQYELIGLKELFVVSGMPKRNLDSINFISHINPYPELSIAIAYNPFFPSSESQILEDKRLKTKLSYPFINTVFIQLGQDLGKYKLAIEYIRNIKPEVKIIAAVLNPQASRIISSFKLRPWNGVYFTPKYLTDLDYRLALSIDLIKSLDDLGVQVLLEFYSKSEEIQNVINL